MTSSSEQPPVHDSLSVLDHVDIYHNDEWRKAAVRYQYSDEDEYDEVAVYLWHNEDGEWKRKNKYVIKTINAWQTDRQIIERLLTESAPQLGNDDVPVSDYYNVVAGETVFKSDDWWKAIVQIDQKGSYETEETFVYLWQRVDGDWRRRQKYTIKSQDRWGDESETIESLLGIEQSRQPDAETTHSDSPTSGDADDENWEEMPDEFEQLSREIDDHLSETLRD